MLLAACGETTANAPLPAARISGVPTNGLVGQAGQQLPDPVGVTVYGSDDEPLPGAPVTFAAGNGGAVNPATATTDANGVARTRWTLGPTPGPNLLTATSGSASTALTATGTAGPPASVAVSAGNNQHAPAGRLVPIAPAVVVKDAAGAAVAGVIVNFAVATGGGSLIGARQVTDVAGIATVGGWFLGDLPGPNTLTATVTGLPPVTFTATGDAGQAVSLVAVSATSQSAPVNTNVASPPSVVVRDVAGSPVAGVVVTFTVTAGGGTVTGSPVTTNASGVATVASWKLGPAVGPNTVQASAPGLPTVTFNATGTAGAPAAVAATAGDNQAAVQGTAVPQAPTVKVTDAGGNPVQGVAVTFAVVLGGGTAVGLNQVTDALGLASVGSWILGSGAPNTLRATVTGTGITGNPVTFTAQSATQIGITAAPTTAVTLGTNFTVSVQLRNSAGASVSLAGIPLTISIATGGGTLNGTAVQTTNTTGAATFTINVTGTAGDRTFTVSGAGLTSATTASITFN